MMTRLYVVIMKLSGDVCLSEEENYREYVSCLQIFEWLLCQRKPHYSIVFQTLSLGE